MHCIQVAEEFLPLSRLFHTWGPYGFVLQGQHSLIIESSEFGFPAAKPSETKKSTILVFHPLLFMFTNFDQTLSWYCRVLPKTPCHVTHWWRCCRFESGGRGLLRSMRSKRTRLLVESQFSSGLLLFAHMKKNKQMDQLSKDGDSHNFKSSPFLEMGFAKESWTIFSLKIGPCAAEQPWAFIRASSWKAAWYLAKLSGSKSGLCSSTNMIWLLNFELYFQPLDDLKKNDPHVGLSTMALLVPQSVKRFVAETELGVRHSGHVTSATSYNIGI